MKNLFTALLAATIVAPAAFAQTYTYRAESFEDPAFATSAAQVTSATGQWTVNKNVQSADLKYDGDFSLYFAKKDGVMLPELTEGAGTLIYYAYDQNRQYVVEKSTDGSTWTEVATEKPSNTAWVKYVFDINDKDARWVRIRTTSNSQYYLDSLLLTKPDGTDGDGNVIVSNLNIPYFTNTFEHSNFPSSKEEAATEKTYTVDGQGEWKYLNAYKNTNEAYIPDGSGRSLRMLKTDSHVISPVVEQGVVKLTFDEGRSSKYLSVYTSADGGATWNLLREIVTEKHNEITINDRSVNRVKIANEKGKGDTDVDNITLTAFPEGKPASVATGAVSNVGPSSALVAGSITARGDKPVMEKGICWAIGGEPDYDSNRVAASGDADAFEVALRNLPAKTLIQARAYAIGLSGIGYGDVVQFTTMPAQTATIETGEPQLDDFSDEQHIFYTMTCRIADDGGAAPTEVGVVYSQSSNPVIENNDRVKGYLYDGVFTVSLALAPEKTYNVRPYAYNEAGIGYGEEKEIVTGKLEIPVYEHNVYWCDPNGDDATADGSEQKPFHSLQKAVDLAKAGDTIYMNAGTYEYTSRINIPTVGAPNSGMIRLEGHGGRALLDFAKQGLGDNNQGIRLTGSYWHFYGIDIHNAGDNGLLIERNKPTGGTYNDIAARTQEGHDNVIENCTFVRNQDTGLQMKNLATYNRVINCDAFYNTDPDHGDADGFAVKISHGTGNYFYGCRAWQNSDDGWDQFIKQDGGFPDDVTTTLEYCWAFENGYLEDGSVSKGNGNGFKMGSDQGRNNVIMNRCLAFDNLNKGFDQNHNTGSMILNNCNGFNLADKSNKSRYTYRLDEAVAKGKEIRLTNCVSVCDGDDRNTATYAISALSANVVTDHCDLHTLPADYISVDSKEMKAGRSADGSLPHTDFLRPTEGNAKFLDKGVEVVPEQDQSRYAEGIRFAGAAPDLGYYEEGLVSGVTAPQVSMAADCRLHAVVTRSGQLLMTVDGADASTRHTALLYDLGGRLVGTYAFAGHTALMSIDAPAGTMLILRVVGPSFADSLKIRMR